MKLNGLHSMKGNIVFVYKKYFSCEAKWTSL